MNVFRGLKKSQSGPNLTFSERISFSRKSKREKGRSGVESPLPPRPPSRSVAKGRIIENIPENRVFDVRHGNHTDNLQIRGRVYFRIGKIDFFVKVDNNRTITSNPPPFYSYLLGRGEGNIVGLAP